MEGIDSENQEIMILENQYKEHYENLVMLNETLHKHNITNPNDIMNAFATTNLKRKILQLQSNIGEKRKTIANPILQFEIILRLSILDEKTYKLLRYVNGYTRA